MTTRHTQELGALSARLQAAVRAKLMTRRQAVRTWLQAVDEASGHGIAQGVRLIASVMEEFGLPVQLREYIVLTSAVATYLELSGADRPLVCRGMLEPSRAASLGRELGLDLLRRRPDSGLAPAVVGAFRNLRHREGAARSGIADARRRWRTVRDLRRALAEPALSGTP